MGSEQLWFLIGSCSPLDRLLFAFCSPIVRLQAKKRRLRGAGKPFKSGLTAI